MLFVGRSRPQTQVFSLQFPAQEGSTAPTASWEKMQIPLVSKTLHSLATVCLSVLGSHYSPSLYFIQAGQHSVSYMESYVSYLPAFAYAYRAFPFQFCLLEYLPSFMIQFPQLL